MLLSKKKHHIHIYSLICHVSFIHIKKPGFGNIPALKFAY